ncbi:16794_t:CDS:2, partial [Acaulospora colombiana]
MSHQHNFAPRARQHQHQQAQGATGLEGSYNEPSASTSTMDPFATSNENDYNDMNPLQHIGIHGNRDTLDWLISTYGAPSQTNLGHSASPSHTISPSIYSSLNTPAEHMGASPYLPTPVDYPSHPFHHAAATAASGGNPPLFAQTSSSPLVHAHPSHFVSTSTIPQWHSPTQDSILSSSAPASMSPLHYTSHNQHQQHQQPQPRFGGGSVSANTSPYGQLYQPTPAPGQIGPSLFQNNPLTPPPHPPLTNVTHSPLITSTSGNGGGPPPRPLTNPASLQIPGAHHLSTEPVSASTPLDASSL